MIVKKMENTLTVACPKGGFISHRYLTEKDNMGFTLTMTYIPQNGVQHWHYKNHLEACICIQGHGVLKDLKTNEKYDITEDVMYALNEHDDHEFEALEETFLVCVFNPALKGSEVHNEDGSYE